MDYLKIYKGVIMETRDYLIILYDFYGELFNEKQKLYFENYYLENLSLSEISENLGVSRNAIHKVIQSMEEKLLFYEEKLELYKKNKIIYDIINLVDDDKIKEMLKGLI